MNVAIRVRLARELIRAEWRRSAGVRLLGATVWIAGVATLTGFHVNVSRSLPLGLYFWDRSAPVERGAIVLACLPPEWGLFAQERGILGSGYCPGWTRPIGKTVLAMVGDAVELRPDGLLLNGSVVLATRPLTMDRRGRTLPLFERGRHTLRADEVWLHSPYHPASFDSRYYGPIPIANVRAVARPLWTSR